MIANQKRRTHSLKMINLLLYSEIFVQAQLDLYLETQDNLITPPLWYVNLSAKHFLAKVMHE